MFARCTSYVHALSVPERALALKPQLKLADLSKSSYPRLKHVRLLHAPAESCSSSPQTPISAFPVVLLSGFLGAGKTTVLEQILRQHHGYKLGVVVNDLASVNIDANVLRDSIKDSNARSVSLQNGCVCCTAADDLKESVQNLLRVAGTRELDAIVVELSGVAEPARAKNVLETPGSTLLKDKPLSVRTVTVVDTPSFSVDYLSEKSDHHHHDHAASGECDERYGSLLAEQVESANLLLLNKADVASEQELTQTQAMVKALNEAAAVHITEHGKVNIEEFLSIEPKSQRDRNEKVVAGSLDELAASPKACCVAKTCSSTNKNSATECASTRKLDKSLAEARFGITSFVYMTTRMMSRAKLLQRLSDWQKARESLGNKLNLVGLSCGSTQESTRSEKGESSPLAPILRSKGIVLLDANPEVAFYWSHAGKSVSFSVFGPWPENAPQEQVGFESRRTELVFIGTGYEESAIRDLLDSCLLSEDECQAARESYKSYKRSLLS